MTFKRLLRLLLEPWRKAHALTRKVLASCHLLSSIVATLRCNHSLVVENYQGLARPGRLGQETGHNDQEHHHNDGQYPPEHDAALPRAMAFTP